MILLNTFCFLNDIINCCFLCFVQGHQMDPAYHFLLGGWYLLILEGGYQLVDRCLSIPELIVWSLRFISLGLRCVGGRPHDCQILGWLHREQVVVGQECLQERDARELGDATIAMMQLKDQAKLKQYLHLLIQLRLIYSWHFSKIQDARYFATVAEYFVFRSLLQWPHHIQS